MIDPENWPLWVQLLAFPPMLFGAMSCWLPLAKSPKWRGLQIGCIIYFALFAIFFWAKQPAIGFVLIAIGLFGLLVLIYLRHQEPH